MKKMICLIMAVILISVAYTNAEVPRYITYQGILTELNGNPKPDGSYNVNFTLFDAQSGGAMKWTETQTVTTADGLFTVKLGSINQLNEHGIFEQDLWLEIQVENEPPLSPRIQLTTVPYAFKSILADSADHLRKPVKIRPLNPKISGNEISMETVTRHIKIYPVPTSDSVSIMSDTVYFIGGENIRIRQNGDSILIHASIPDSTDSASGGNTLDQAYDQGGPGDGREIHATDGPVYIDGEHGLQVTGIDNVIFGFTEETIYSGRFENTGADGVALKAEITDSDNPNHAFKAISSGEEKSTAIHSLVTSNGKGRAGVFEISNSSNSVTSLEAYTQGPGQALHAYDFHPKARAGIFENQSDKSTEEVMYAHNYGVGPGIYARTRETPSGLPDTAAIIGFSKNRKGIFGWSDTLDGVFGKSGHFGNYDIGPGRIVAGVHGLSSTWGGSADNFGTAGIARGYGTGVIGIGSGEGHGVYGVSGTNSSNSVVAVRGVTREDSAGGRAWPPYFPIDEEAPYSKKKLAMLGQAVKSVAIWGESIEKIGVIGTVGKRVGIGEVTGLQAALAGKAYNSGAYGVYAKSDSGIAAKFEISDQDNTNPVLWLENNGFGETAYLKHSKTNNSDPAMFIDNYGSGISLFLGHENGFTTAPVLKIGNKSQGRSAEIVSENVMNTSSVIYGLTHGKGRSAEFEIDNPTNTNVVLYNKTNGGGRVGYFEINNANNLQQSVYATTNGKGRVAEFDIYNPQNNEIAVFAYTNGLSNAGYFQIDNAQNNRAAIWGITNGTGYAGYFNGRVHVNGVLSKSSGQFKIDHPLDPENKYLNHSFVESTDMKNIYDGVVQLDQNGEAVVQLEEWFEAVNKDFRYQLTAIGKPGPNLYIAEEISGNQFRIAGGSSGMKVSWQITGIRKDRFAEKYRIQVEEEKTGDEKGKYLHPGLFGRSDEYSIFKRPTPGKPSASPEKINSK